MAALMAQVLTAGDRGGLAEQPARTTSTPHRRASTPWSTPTSAAALAEESDPTRRRGPRAARASTSSPSSPHPRRPRGDAPRDPAAGSAARRPARARPAPRPARPARLPAHDPRTRCPPAACRCRRATARAGRRRPTSSSSATSVRRWPLRAVHAAARLRAARAVQPGPRLRLRRRAPRGDPRSSRPAPTSPTRSPAAARGRSPRARAAPTTAGRSSCSPSATPTRRAADLVAGPGRRPLQLRRPLAAVLERLVDRARHAYWLNPERRAPGTPATPRREYAAVVPMVECRNLAQLRQFVRSLPADAAPARRGQGSRTILPSTCPARCSRCASAMRASG